MASKYLTGNDMDRIPNIAFRGMAFMFVLRDFFVSVDKRIEAFGIKKGNTIIDYGCGTGSYLKKATELVGEQGMVYAVDVHPLSMKKVQKRIDKLNLKNVIPVLSGVIPCNIDDHVANVIYALDMFHMVSDPDQFLKELHRLIKKRSCPQLVDI